MEFRHPPHDPAVYGPGDGSVPWQNADPSIGQNGSRIPAEALSGPQSEIVQVIDQVLGDGSAGSGQNAADLTQLFQAFKLMAGSR